MASVQSVSSYDAQSALPTKKRSKSDKEFIPAVNVLTLEIMLFLLREEGVESRSSFEYLSPNDELREQLTKAMEALMSMSKSMLKDYGPEMRQLCGTLDLSDEQFYATYCLVAENSLGYPDVSLGRIVSLMTFTGLLASHLIKRGEDSKVESLLGWERMFIANKCQPCIEALGGWKSIRMPHKESNIDTRGSTAGWLAPVVVVGLGIAAALGGLLAR